MSKQSKSALANPQSAIRNPQSAEGYTVLARRCRPQQFDEIVGQEPIARALVNALKANRVAHAYLFTGPRGVGKTSTARILAKALNCVNGPTPTPCDACDMCRGIASGEDVDVLEIDGASNRGIDEVREIRGNVQYRPSRSRFKIYIVDEVHMLTPPAFNALLKTLEEPPPHVKFIFATTEVQRIPVTILSRCQRFDFAGIGTPRILAQLRQVVAGEGIEADNEALELVARRAAGSMRDAQSLLDQLLAFGGGRLTADQVHRLLGTAQEDRVVELASAVLGHDAQQALALLARAADEGAQLGELLDQLIAYWRDLMVLSCSAGEGTDLSVSGRHRETLAQQAAALSLDTILAGLDVLSATKARLRGSSHARILLEMALARLSRLDNLVALTQLARWVSQAPAPRIEDRGSRIESGRGGQSAPGPQSSIVDPRSSTTVEPPEAVKKKPPDAARSPGPVPLSEGTLPAVWKEVLARVGPLLALNLEKADPPAISGPNNLVIRFPARYNRECEYCQRPGPFEQITKVLRGVAGGAWNLRMQSAGGEDVTQPPPAAASTENSLSRSRRQRDEAEKEPLIQRAMEVLGADIVRIDDGFGMTPTPAVERVAGTAGTEEG